MSRKPEDLAETARREAALRAANSNRGRLATGNLGDVVDWAYRWQRERRALVQCARALALTYGGTSRPKRSVEKQALWDAMHVAYDALGVDDTRDLAEGATP